MTATVDPPAQAGATKPTAPAGVAFTHRQIMTILVGLLMGMFLAALDQTVVSTAIRTIGDDLNNLSAQAWVTTAFLITSTIATPLYGKLSDVYGRKPFFLAAISIFIVGSAACSFAQSMYMLAAFRAFQGLGAGGLFTLALAIIGDIIPPRERAKYQGYFLAVFGTSSVLGPVIGGFLAGRPTILGFTGWRWIFLINVPIGIAALVVVVKVLHIPHVSRPHRIDYWGATLLIVGLVPLLIVAEQGRTWGWGSGGALACYAVGVLGLVAFVFAESRAGEDALIPLRLFRVGTFAIGSGQSFILGIGMFGGITLIPLWLQIVKGASPTKSGLLMLPLVIGIMLASIVAGQITSRTGRYKIFPVIGSVLLVAGMLLLWRLSADTSLVYADLSMLVVGSGLGLSMQSIVLAMQNAVPPRDIGVATSSTTFFRQMGGTLGVAVFLSILYSLLPTKIGTLSAAAAQDPTYQQALTPGNRRALAGAANDTTLLNGLPGVLTRPWKEGFSSSMDVVFLVGASVLVVAFLLALRLKEVPLRTTAGMGAENPAGPAGATGLDPAAATATDAGAAAGVADVAGAAAPADASDVPGAAPQGSPDPSARPGSDPRTPVGGQPTGPEGGRHEIAGDDLPAGAVTVESILAHEDAARR